MQTARDHFVKRSKLKEAADYFKRNPNLTPKVINIKYMVDFNTKQRFKTTDECERWLWAVHGQVHICIK